MPVRGTLSGSGAGRQPKRPGLHPLQMPAMQQSSRLKQHKQQWELRLRRLNLSSQHLYSQFLLPS